MKVAFSHCRLSILASPKRIAEARLPEASPPGAVASSTFIADGKVSGRFLERPAKQLGGLLARHAPFPLTPALSPREREKRSPLLKKTRGWVGESRTRFTRGQRSTFLLPEVPSPMGVGEGARRADEGRGDKNKPCGEGQDEGEKGAHLPGRTLSSAHPAFIPNPLETSRNRATRVSIVNSRGFTMIEVALCLAIIGFALVSILAVLPLGMDSQQRTRQATIVSQDATMFLEAIRNGTRGLDDLTNYVVAITNYYQGYNTNGQPLGKLHSAGYIYNAGSIDLTPQNSMNLTNGLRIVGILSTPEFTTGSKSGGVLGGPPVIVTPGVYYTSNRVYAYIRSVSGLAVEKPPQNNDIMRGASFSYQVLCVNAPLTQLTNVIADHSAIFDQQLAGNLRELWLLFRWPLLPNSSLPARPNRQDYRADVAGQILLTNDYPLDPTKGMGLYFCQSQLFTNTP